MEKKQSKTKRETIWGRAFGYDDGSSVFFYQRGEEDGAGVEIRYFANEEELWHFLRGLKNRSKSHDREFDINAGNIKVNLGYTARHKNERAASVLEDKKRCNELLKMLDSCGADEDSRRTLIEILSATLVGHFSCDRPVFCDHCAGFLSTGNSGLLCGVHHFGCNSLCYLEVQL